MQTPFIWSFLKAQKILPAEGLPLPPRTRGETSADPPSPLIPCANNPNPERDPGKQQLSPRQQLSPGLLPVVHQNKIWASLAQVSEPNNFPRKVPKCFRKGGQKVVQMWCFESSGRVFASN